jgi:hypothetical protein
MINTKLQSIIDTKSAIGNAIVNKGGTITSETPFFNYAAEIDSISTGPESYSAWVVQDVNNAKYTSITNIIDGTSGGNNTYTFNRWLLNNSAGTPLLANTVMATTDDVIVNIVGENQANMAFINNTASYGGTIQTLSTNNGFIYAGGDTNQTVQKFYEDNLAFVGNTANYGGSIRGITTNNGFIYVGGQTNATVQKFYESNLAFVGNTATYGNGGILSVIVNNGYIYVGGFDNVEIFTGTIRKYHESNLAFDSNSTTTNGVIQQIVASNNNLYIAGGFNINSVLVYHESNLVFINSTGNYGDRVISTVVNNGYIYAGGWGTNTIKRYYDSNFAFLDNSATYGNLIEKIVLDNGFIYAGGRGNATANRDIKKYHESNLAFVGNTVNYGGSIFNGLIINNNALYVGGDTNNTVKKYQAAEIVYDNIPIFSITSLKEE